MPEYDITIDGADSSRKYRIEADSGDEAAGQALDRLYDALYGDRKEQQNTSKKEK